MLGGPTNAKTLGDFVLAIIFFSQRKKNLDENKKVLFMRVVRE